MAGKFILSLDCEGKWGSADRLTPQHQRALSNDRLTWAYRSILEILDEFHIPATFAVVGAFALAPDEFGRVRPQIEALSRSAPGYLGPALRDIDRSGGDGWHGHRLVGAITHARTTHEVALHGVTHVPWTAWDEASAEAEMGIFDELDGTIRKSRTFVYPRNLVAYPDVLARHGMIGFRTARPAGSRAWSLLSEFNLFERPETPQPMDGIVRIPAGFFLNWRSGLRRLVPPAVTRLRARRLLTAAAANAGIVHYWLHPENIASAPSTLELLRSLVREVASSRDSGDCEVMTQLGYCAWAESLR